jgi:hypothetical protein
MTGDHDTICPSATDGIGQGIRWGISVDLGVGPSQRRCLVSVSVQKGASSMSKPVRDVDMDHQEVGFILHGQFRGSADDALAPVRTRHAGDDERSRCGLGQPPESE